MAGRDFGQMGASERNVVREKLKAGGKSSAKQRKVK